MPDLTTRAVVSSYITTGGASPAVAFPAETRAGDVVGIVLTTNDSARLMTGAPAGWTLVYNTAFGTASRMLLWKVYASSDGASVALPFSAQPAMQCTVFVLDGTVHSGLGAAGAVTTRGASGTTITAAAAGGTGAPNLVIAHEKASSHPSIASVSPATTTLANVTNGGASTAAQYVGSYDTSGGTAARTITYGTASANGAGVQVPVVMATVVTPTVQLAQFSNTVAGALRGGWWVTGGTTYRAVASLSPSFTSPLYSGPLTPGPVWGGVTGSVAGLADDTVYYLGLEVDGVIHPDGRGTIRTIQPERVAGTSTWATGSCNYTGSNHVVFDRIRLDQPRSFTHQGDDGYPDTNDGPTWRTSKRSTMTTARRQALAAVVPITWDPDNHDAGGNRSHSAGAWVAIAKAAMREVTGDYAGPDGFYRTWVDRGVQHVEIDRWSFRDKDTTGTGTDGDASTPKADNDPTKVMLGATQEAWLLNILATSTAAAIVVYTGFPLTASRFGFYQVETARIAAAIAALPLAQRAKIIGVGGDSHDIRANSGTSKSVWGIPTLNASGLDQSGAAFDTTGWDIGIISPVEVGRGYYSRIAATDDLSTMTLGWQAVRDDNTVLMSWSRSLASTTPVATTRSTTWATRARPAPTTRAAAWAVRAATTPAVRATTWATRARVPAAARSTSWATRVRTTLTRAALWNVTGPITSTGTTRATSWAARTRVTATRNTAWAARARATLTRPASWATRTSLTAATVPSWAVRQRVTDTATTTWGSRRLATAGRSTTWAARGRVTLTRPAVWNVAPQPGVVTLQRAAGWQTRGRVTSTRSTTWPTRTTITPSRSTSWAVRRPLTTGRTTSWADRQRVMAGRATTWSVTAGDAPAGGSFTITATLRPRPWASALRPRTWTARTTMATDTYPAGTDRRVTTDVTADVELGTQQVEIGLTTDGVRTWHPAGWVGTPGKTRAAQTTEVVTFDSEPYVAYAVHVRVTDLPVVEVMDAGDIHLVP